MISFDPNDMVDTMVDTVDTTVSFEKALYVIDRAIQPLYLNKIQEIILEQTWYGKTYSEIASSHSYEFEYIKGAGSELWRLLSQAFDEQISKSNFVQFMRRKTLLAIQNQIITDTCTPSLIHSETNDSARSYCWTTAPDVSKFQGQTAEIAQLKTWSRDYGCRFILVSGMVGCGKTALVTKFARQEEREFDCILWISLNNAPHVELLLKNCLKLMSVQLNLDLLEIPDNFDNLLNLLIQYLRQYRCLMILDGLQSIIEVGSAAVYYRNGYERYGHLLRCIITTQHRSLSIATSQIKPKVLCFYNREQVRFLTLKGLDDDSLNKIFLGRDRGNISEVKWQEIWQYYMYNPQIINIIVTKIESLENTEIDEFFSHITPVDEIDYLLDLELNSLSSLEKEIIHWLAIDCNSDTIEKLTWKMVQSASKTKLLESMHNLKERTLVKKSGATYILAPLIKDYLQRRLIHLSLPKLAESRLIRK